ncbi:MAG: TetR family transcriptional regulator [Parafilimonas sp.]
MVKIKDLSTEQKILEAARQVFFDKGMHGARMQDIADKAGINKAMLHYYFRSKDKLFETIFTDASNHFFPMLNAIIESDKTVFEKIEVLCIEYINQVGKMPYLPVFILSEASRQQQVFLKKLWTRQKLPLKSFTGMIETAVREKKIKPVDPLQLLMNILSLCIFPFAAQPIFQHAAGISKKEYETMIEERKKTIPRLIIQSIKK